MDLPSQFEEYLGAIRLTDDQREACIAAHREVREKLAADPLLGEVVVATFLQGSYVRHTIVNPSGLDLPDVDVVVVTRLSKDEYTPDQAIKQFSEFLETNYPERYKFQGRSIGIRFPTVDLDLVVTAAPSESVEGILLAKMSQEPQELWTLLEEFTKSEEWKSEPLLIPDRDAQQWVPTDPLEQIEWTRKKNAETNGHFVNVVKVIKRWRDIDGQGKRPKGFLVERLVGLHCPDYIKSVASGVEATFSSIKEAYASHSVEGTVPDVPDIGIPANNVFKRISAQEFRDFYGCTRVASAAATDAYEDPDSESSGTKWRELFGDDFPSDSGGGGSSHDSGPPLIFPPPTRASEAPPGRFA